MDQLSTFAAGVTVGSVTTVLCIVILSWLANRRDAAARRDLDESVKELTGLDEPCEPPAFVLRRDNSGRAMGYEEWIDLQVSNIGKKQETSGVANTDNAKL